ncbi:nitrate- and nitrite sensing domain-containing protein [Kitasatospora sp. MAP5-34]|uniref:nitrate- and nitrite sensing domain-containing protein n=1 Tax=Kitasatospora sp. MAP5-34 TaxID=3035102 RepID=UPI002472F250|nr:nitrate- and nitrite sensing domain-containing protein [Kitasatospora sp. MAP5-34]
MAGPHQATPITSPGEQTFGAGAESEQDTVEGAEQPGKRSGRSRLRGTLNRRRATGLSRFAMRNWRIRTRLIALLLLPVVVALVLGGLRIQASIQNSQQLSQMTGLSDLAKKATALADALQTERDISAGPLTSQSSELDDVSAARKTTDDLSKAFAASADNFDQLDLSGDKALLLQVRKDLNQLSDARSNAYTKDDNIQATITNYDVIIKDLLGISQDLAIGSNSTELVKVTRALQQFSLAKESSSEQRALISAALARPGQPDLSTSDETFGIRLQVSEDNALLNFTAIYGDAQAKALRAPLSYNQVISDADRYSKTVLNLNGIRQAQPRSYKSWYDDASAKINGERKIESTLLEALDGKAGQLQSDADTQTLLNGALIALVLIVAIAGAAIVARGMVRSLTRLQTAAEDVAERRLPELVKTLSESDPHDVDVTVEPVGIDSSDEIGHVAHAFDMVHKQAVSLAAEQALLRGNINAMFTNLSRRSQGLIQRQLSLISELESREADPDQLASLFKLDHLATRMRRNGENLLVLAGEDPGRRWTRPVPLVDVLRAAASEVEQYERVELAAVPSAEVAGRVVNDLVHLLAELLENATSFSSPQTRVRVTGHALPDGRVLIEIHDTGIGLSPDDLADINERLANPPVVDVSVSRRMGLFVVGRLSLRHGIRIQLRPSDSGGTTALVMLPLDVTTAADRRTAGRPAGPAQARQQRGAGPTPRQQGRAGMAETALPMRPQPGAAAGALPQGPAGAPTGRPQLGQGPQGGPGGQPQQGGRPGAPAQAPNGSPTGGLPTREVGQALRETPPNGRPPRRTPGASGAPGVQQGPGGGLPRRGRAPEQGQQPQQNQQGPAGGRRPAQERPRPGVDQPTAGQPTAGRPGPRQAPQGPGQGQAPGQGQGQPQGRPVRPQPQDGPAQRPPYAQERPSAPQDQQAQLAPQPQGRQPQAPQQSMAPLPAAPVESTVQFARPRFEASEIDPRDPLGLGLVEPVLPSVASPAPQQPQVQQPQAPIRQLPPQAPQQPQGQQQPMALPTGPGQRPEPGQAGQFGQFESAEAQARSYQPRRPGTSAPGFAEQPQGRPAPQQGQQGQQGQRQMPQQGQQQAGRPPQQDQPQERPRPDGASDAPWRPSANDERWRRAEQVREPSTGGITMSGLPRRTPQANLVSGTAEAAPLTGPQVSRAPEEVRGRLTNLRRGIQQGRQAGADAAQSAQSDQQQTQQFQRPQPGQQFQQGQQGQPGQGAQPDQHGRAQQRFDGFGSPRNNGGNGSSGPDHQER